MKEPSLFSRVYLERGPRQIESDRARKRFIGFLTAFENELKLRGVEQRIRYHFPTELGLSINLGLFDVGVFLRKAPWIDVLDGISLLATCFGSERATWIEFVRGVFEEENLAYRIDDDGGVHPFVDAEFTRQTASSLEALDQPRFGQARAEFEAMERNLRSGDSLGALRSVFACAESVFKVLFPGESRLDASAIDKKLAPALATKMGAGNPLSDAGKLTLSSFKGWTNASHQFRHGSGSHAPVDVPSDLLIVHVSGGVAFTRWLIQAIG